MVKKQPQVKEAVAIIWQQSESVSRLVVYLVLDSGTEAEPGPEDVEDFNLQLKQLAKVHLPPYMIPSGFIYIEALPLSANGKLDRKALPSPTDSMVAEQYVAANTDTERQLLGIWVQLLNLDESQISTTANFFTLGGHSVLLIRLIASIKDIFDIDVTLEALFERPQIKTLAQMLDTEIQSARLAVALADETQEVETNVW